jgi:hypothetical protein
MGRPLLPLSIGAEDQAQLQAWTRRPKTAQALAMRSRVILLAAEPGHGGPSGCLSSPGSSPHNH